MIPDALWERVFRVFGTIPVNTARLGKKHHGGKRGKPVALSSACKNSALVTLPAHCCLGLLYLSHVHYVPDEPVAAKALCRYSTRVVLGLSRVLIIISSGRPL